MSDGQPYGIIDPDYARIYTVARCIAWSEGYAILMHGSFTRDLDLLAVPWAEEATDAEHLIRRITLALDDLSLLVKDPTAPSQASQKPHGRLTWTLTFKTFGDPRFVDIGVMPRAPAPDRGDGTRGDGDGWRDISTAPKDGTPILITRPSQFTDEHHHVVYWVYDWWQVHDGKNDHPLRGPDPTHWRPLPPPPAAGDRDGGGQ